MSKWTPGEDEGLVAIIRQGMRDEDVAAAVGRSPESCKCRRLILTRKGVDLSVDPEVIAQGARPYKSLKNWSPQEDEVLLRMRAENKSASQIGLALGRSRVSVNDRSRLLLKAGRTKSVAPQLPQSLLREAVIAAGNETPAELASRTGTLYRQAKAAIRKVLSMTDDERRKLNQKKRLYAYYNGQRAPVSHADHFPKFDRVCYEVA